MTGNPAPRAALARKDGTVARVPLTQAPVRDDEVAQHVPALVPVVEASDPASAKAKGKKHHKGDHGKQETVEVVVTLSKPVRRALKAAASDRDTTPEELASLVLTAWLDR